MWAAAMTREGGTSGQSNGDTSSKKKRVGARSCRCCASHRSSRSHHPSCSSRHSQNRLGGHCNSRPQQSGACGSQRRGPTVGYAHWAGLHQAQAHSWGPHTHTHWTHAHAWWHHAQHGIGRHGTGAEAAQAEWRGLRWDGGHGWSHAERVGGSRCWRDPSTRDGAAWSYCHARDWRWTCRPKVNTI